MGEDIDKDKKPEPPKRPTLYKIAKESVEATSASSGEESTDAPPEE